MDITAIVTTSISAVATVIVAITNLYMNSQRKKDNEEARQLAERNAAKSSIQNMITQDIIQVEVLKKSSENYKAILEEYDRYTKSGGNSYVKDKVKNYCLWYDSINKKNKSKRKN